VPKTVTRVARGAASPTSTTTNIALVKGRLVAVPTVRIVDRHRRATTFDLATQVHGRRSVVPVVAVNLNLPALKVGDEVTVLGYVRRRFFRVGARTQSITELMVEELVTGASNARLEKLYEVFKKRGRETRTASLPKSSGERA
jgi:hypothetical protein